MGQSCLDCRLRHAQSEAKVYPVETNMSTPSSRITRCCRWLAAWAAIFLLIGCFQSPVHAETGKIKADTLPFIPGERLTYALRWGVVPAGTVVLEVLPLETVSGVDAHHFAVTATSNRFVDTFYPVRDRVDAYADLNMTRSLFYKKKQLEGRHRRDEVVTFDWAASTVTYENFGKKRKPVPIAGWTFDPLSVFYAFRGQQLQRGSSLHTAVTDGKKCVIGTAVIVDRQIVQVPCGAFDTFLVEPDLKNVGGVFKKSDNASLRIWVTADHRRIPVKVASRVMVGDFVAELVSMEGCPLDEGNPADMIRALSEGCVASPPPESIAGKGLTQNE